jgi:hypothetical protein
MHRYELLLLVIAIGLQGLIIRFLMLRGTWRKFPLFFLYFIYCFVQGIGMLVTFLKPEVYFYFFWFSAPLEILLTVVAVLESFWAVFRSFRLLYWFRFVLPAAIATALAYSAWQGYHFYRSVVGESPAAEGIVKAVMTAHYSILAVVILFFLLVRVLDVAWRVHEYRFMLGFGVASLAAAFGASVRAVFDSRFDLISRDAAPIGYLMALLIWLSAAIHPVPEQPVFQTLSDAQVQELVENLRIQLRSLSSFVRKSRL